MEQLTIYDAMVRRNDMETSRDAAILALPNVANHRQRVLHALYHAGWRGLTDFELEARTGIRQTSAGKRRLELERAGLVTRCMMVDPVTLQLVPGRRPAPSGASAAVWEITPAGREACSGPLGVSNGT